MPVEKPYVVTVHDLIDRMAKPPTVKPGREYSRHTTENAARKALNNGARGCIMNGPKSLAVLTGPGLAEEVWFKGDRSSPSGGGYVTLSLKLYQHRGGFVVVEESPSV